MAEGYIHKLEFSLTISGKGLGKEAQDMADDCYDKYVGPVVEEVISRYSKEYDIDIDSISIDLGDIDPEDIPSILRAKLEDELDKHIRKPVSAPVDKQDILLQYVAEESVPWSVPSEEFLPGEIISEEPEKYLKNIEFMKDVLGTEQALIRLLNILDNDSFQIFIENLPVYINAGIMTSSPVYKKVLARIRLKDNAELLSGLVHPHESETADAQTDVIQAKSSGQSREIEQVNEIPDKHKSREKVTLSPSGDTAESSGDTTEPSGDTITKEVLSESFNPENEINGKITEELKTLFQDIKDGKIPDSQIVLLKEADISSTEKERFSTASAGLVIFHPFMTRFLKKIGLMDESGQAFKSKQAQVEAVHVLFHMAHPDSKHHSHMMCLEKIMCGLSPYVTIPMEWQASDSLNAEISSLFKAVCGHWRPLNGTSEEGLRNTFIARNGLLNHEGGSWILHVESQAVDILLDDLPWEISTILLNCSDDFLIVDWHPE